MHKDKAPHIPQMKFNLVFLQQGQKEAFHAEKDSFEVRKFNILLQLYTS